MTDQRTAFIRLALLPSEKDEIQAAAAKAGLAPAAFVRMARAGPHPRRREVMPAKLTPETVNARIAHEGWRWWASS